MTCLRKRGIIAVVLAACLSSMMSTRASADYVGIINESNAAIEALGEHEQWKGILNIFGGAKAVLIAPDFTSGAFVVGIEKGTGIMLARYGEQWSDPLFVKFEQTSVGFQIGGKESEFMMLVLTRKAVEDYIEGERKIGGTGGFALGKWGIGASGSGGISGGVQTVTVTTSEGLSLGGGVADTVMTVRIDLNRKAYGDDFAVDKIIGRPGGTLPAAAALRATLADIVRAAWRE